MHTLLAEIDKQFDRLSLDQQLLLIEQLAHLLRERNRKSWEASIDAAAADPEIQAELRQIEREFAGTEMDGLELDGATL
jgi:hypothetical protein